MNDLAAAKLAVMQKVPYLRKSKATGLAYTFAGEREFIRRLHPVLVEVGLAIAPVAAVLERSETYQTGRGAAMNRVLVRVTYRLTHAASGQAEDIQVLGEAADVGDKGTGKAMTAALKYALRQAFLVETGDDPDRQPSDGQVRAQPAQAPAPDAMPMRTTSPAASNGPTPAGDPAELIDALLRDRLVRQLFEAQKTWPFIAAWLAGQPAGAGFRADARIDDLTRAQAEFLLRKLADLMARKGAAK